MSTDTLAIVLHVKSKCVTGDGSGTLKLKEPKIAFQLAGVSDHSGTLCSQSVKWWSRSIRRVILPVEFRSEKAYREYCHPSIIMDMRVHICSAGWKASWVGASKAMLSMDVSSLTNVTDIEQAEGTMMHLHKKSVREYVSVIFKD